MHVTKKELADAYKLIIVIADAIREVKEVPAGHLYAMLMARVSLPTFNNIVSTLVKSTLIEKRGDLLVWKEPK